MHLYVQLCSQPVEGGGHRLLTELDDSLTEDDAGADQRDAARDGGDHDRQDQRCRHLALQSRALRSCWERRELNFKCLDLGKNFEGSQVINTDQA